MQDAWKWQVAVGDLLHPRPRQPSPLAATHESAMPAFDHVVPECREGRTAHGDSVIGSPSSQDLGQPLALAVNPLVTGCHKLLLDLSKLGSHALGHWLSPEHEAAAIPAGRAVMREPKKVNVSGLPRPCARRFAFANRPNSMSRVLSVNSSANSRAPAEVLEEPLHLADAGSRRSCRPRSAR